MPINMNTLLPVMFLSFGMMQSITTATHYRFRRISTSSGETLNVTGSIPLRTQTAIQCARMCSQSNLCVHFTWEADHKTCTTIPSQGQNDDAVLESYDYDTRLYSRANKCRLDLGYEILNLKSGRMCVLLIHTPHNFSEAKETCTKLYGLLVKTNTREKMDAISNLGKDNGHIVLGIGLDDEEEEGTFVWSDGKPAKQEEIFFYQIEPNGARSENWAVLYTYLSLLADFPTNLGFPIVCEITMIT